MLISDKLWKLSNHVKKLFLMKNFYKFVYEVFIENIEGNSK